MCWKLQRKSADSGGKGSRGSRISGKKEINGLSFRPMNVICQSDPSVESGDIGLVIDQEAICSIKIITGIQYNVEATQTFLQ